MKRALTSCMLAIVILVFLANAFYHIKKAGDSPIEMMGNIDQYSQYLPHFIFARESILAGSFPLWTPYQAVGRPFFAHMGLGLLYPVNWIIFLMDVPRAMLAIQFLDVVIGMAGMMIFLRYLKLEWPGIILASVLFGYAVLEQSFSHCLGSTYCWLPVIFWLTQRLLDRPGFGACAALSASLALSFLGGFSQFFYYICIITFIYSVFILILSWPRYGYKAVSVRLGLIGLAFVLTLGLVSVQLLPTMQLSLSSVRSLAEKLTPRVVSKTGPLSVEWFKDFLSRNTSRYYFGASLLFIPFAFGSKKQRTVAIGLLGTFAYAILFVLSKQTPALALFGKIPFADTFRFPERMLPLTLFILAALVGVGLSSLWERAPLKLRRPQFGNLDWFWLLAIVCTLAILFAAYADVVELVRSSALYFIIFLPSGALVIGYLLYSSKYPAWAKWAGIALVAFVALVGVVIRAHMLYPVAYLVILLPCVLIFFMSLANASALSHRAKRLAAWVVLLVVLLDVVANRVHIERTVPATTRAELASRASSDRRIAWVKDHAGYSRVLLIRPMSMFIPNAGNMFRFSNINSYDSFTLARWQNFLRLMVGFEEFDRIYGGRVFYGVVDEHIWKKFLQEPRMAGLTSLRYLMLRNVSEDEMRELHEYIDAYGGGWKLKYESGDAEPNFCVYENEFALPRAYVVDRYASAHNEEESLQAIKQNISVLSDSVVLENGEPSFHTASTPGKAGRAQVSRYEINEVELDVEADEPSLVVLTDSYYPGWTAFVDGAEKPVWRANSLFKAVEVAPGNHTVVFKFQPASVRWGIAVSLGSLSLILAGLFLERRFRRSPN